MNWLSAALETLSAGQPAVLVTIADARGSTPREAGVKMLVRLHDIVDSVGGGQLELLAIDAARRLLKQGATRPELMRYSLGPDLGQCCGGAVRLLLEPLAQVDRAWLSEWQTRGAGDSDSELATASDGAKSWSNSVSHHGSHVVEGNDAWRVIEVVYRQTRPVFLFGAGHVGRALAKVLAELPFDVTWLDSRFDGFPDTIPEGVTHRIAPQLAAAVDDAPPAALFLVMTHSHALDLEICDRVLARGDGAFLGLIGSATKKARFLGQLKARGHGTAALDRLVCPIGLPEVPGKQPMAIAVSAAAQLLALPAAVAESRSKQSTGNGGGAG